MPFSWKKKRGNRNRFSQLVADHLQSPKRRGSLVVETGFPTSLIDLYVRNRGRFRRSKKPKGNESPNTVSSCSVVDLNSCSSGGLDHRGIDEIVEENVGFGVGSDNSGSDGIVGVGLVVSECGEEDCIESEVETGVEMARLNPVLVVLLKVFFMVMLSLGTKRFTIGITVSAFLLLFLELVGKRLLARLRFLRSMADLKDRYGSSFQEFKKTKSLEENTNVVGCREVLEIEEQVESKQDVRSEKELDSKALSESTFQETKNVEIIKEDTMLEIEEVESKQEVRSENGLDEVRSDVSMEIRRKTSRRAIMKSRMKKLVPKKLRKPTMGSKEEISYELIEEETVKSAQDHRPLVISNECSDSKGATLRILKQNQDRIVEIEGRSLSSALSSEIDCSGKELRRKLNQNSECLKLCLIVLVGLIGGRVLAVVLALSWCFTLKKLQWRNVKFPIS